MTLLVARTVAPANSVDGSEGERTGIRITTLQASRLGLRPGQMLRGTLISNGSGVRLELGGISLPVPENLSEEGASPLVVQALLTRDGWILKPVEDDQEEPTPIVATRSTPVNAHGIDRFVAPGQVSSGNLLPESSAGPVAQALRALHSYSSPLTGGWEGKYVDLENASVTCFNGTSIELSSERQTNTFLPGFSTQVTTRSTVLPPEPAHQYSNGVGGGNSNSTQQAPLLIQTGNDFTESKSRGHKLRVNHDGIRSQRAFIDLLPDALRNPSMYLSADQEAAPPPDMSTAGSPRLSGSGNPYAPEERLTRETDLRSGFWRGWMRDMDTDEKNHTFAFEKSAQRDWSFGLYGSAAELGGSDPRFTHAPPRHILQEGLSGEPDVLGIDFATMAARPGLQAPDIGPVRMTDPVARDLGLRDGEIVKATVEAEGNGLKLILKGLPIVLPEAHGLQAGDTPTFRVVQSPEGLLLQPLRVPPTSPATLAPVLAQAGTVPQADSNLMSLLLHPKGLAALTQLLSGGLLERTLAALKAPEMMNSRLIERPSMSRLTSTGLRKAISASGLWAESSLNQAKGPAGNDTKLLLLKLLSNYAGDPAVKETLERGLEDIQSAQLQAVQAQANHELLLNLVIPFSDSKPVRLTLYRPAPSKEQPDPPYVVDLHSRSEVLGEIWLKTSISGSMQVDLTMWARLPAVAMAASKGSQSLAKELERAGLTMNSFSVYHGARPEPQTAAPPGAIVNVQA